MRRTHGSTGSTKYYSFSGFNKYMSTQSWCKTALAPLLITAFALSPAFAYAKQGKSGDDGSKGRKETAARMQSADDDDDDDDKDEKRDKNERREERAERLLERREERMNRAEKECLRAFGLLISRGHRTERFEELRDRVCFWPFGIWKKISDGGASTTPPAPDTTAPVISGIKTEPKVFKAEVQWETNEKARCILYYGTTTPLNTATAARISRGPARTHHMELAPLSASTTYYALMSATDLAGNTATSSEFSFTTKSAPPDTTPPVITAVAVLTGTTTISVRWQTNEPATSKLFFSTSTPLNANASTTPFSENATLVRRHRLDLGSLATGTIYYLIAESKDAAGNTHRTNQFQSTTLGI